LIAGEFGFKIAGEVWGEVISGILRLVEGAPPLTRSDCLFDLVLAHLDAVLGAPLDDAGAAPLHGNLRPVEDGDEPLRGALDQLGGPHVEGLQHDRRDRPAVSIFNTLCIRLNIGYDG
jgi:hypothetical protein